ncbi:MAG: ThiF family adenylyltransferase [Methanosphaera sp.]|nr:ThiF family adenylyltransferase [Methanosphaera sp.]
METLKNSKICVFGCGGLGGTVIEHLIRLGFENMTVVDCDVLMKLI